MIKMFYKFNNEKMINVNKILKVTKDITDITKYQTAHPYELVVWLDPNTVIAKIAYNSLEELEQDFENFYKITLDK